MKLPCGYSDGDDGGACDAFYHALCGQQAGFAPGRCDRHTPQGGLLRRLARIGAAVLPGATDELGETGGLRGAPLYHEACAAVGELSWAHLPFGTGLGSQGPSLQRRALALALRSHGSAPSALLCGDLAAALSPALVAAAPSLAPAVAAAAASVLSQVIDATPLVRIYLPWPLFLLRASFNSFWMLAI